MKVQYTDMMVVEPTHLEGPNWWKYGKFSMKFLHSKMIQDIEIKNTGRERLIRTRLIRSST